MYTTNVWPEGKKVVITVDEGVTITIDYETYIKYWRD